MVNRQGKTSHFLHSTDYEWQNCPKKGKTIKKREKKGEVLTNVKRSLNTGWFISRLIAAF